MKLFIAKGNSFTCGGSIYQAGEEIPEGAFSDKGVLAKMIADGKIVEVGHSVEEIADIKRQAIKSNQEALAEIEEIKQQAIEANQEAYEDGRKSALGEIEELKEKLANAEKALTEKGDNPVASTENAGIDGATPPSGTALESNTDEKPDTKTTSKKNGGN